MGDVLCTEPIARKLNRMGFHVYIQTDFAEAYLYNHYVVKVIKKPSRMLKWRKFFIRINLNYAYERRPFLHIVDAYEEKVRASIPGFLLKASEKCPVYDKNITYKGNQRHIQIICINNEGSWKSRTYPYMKDVAIHFKRAGCQIIEIGQNPDYYLGVGDNYYGRLNLHDTVQLMLNCDLYIGMDRGLMHFAQAIHMPSFILFGCTCPNFRIHDWDVTKVMWKNTDTLPCAGCHHRRSAPREFTECDRDRIYCIDWPPEEVICQFRNAPFGNKPLLNRAMYTPYPDL